MPLRTLIVGGQTWDISEFIIFHHTKLTDPLRGKLQYRLLTRGWWGPLVGYKLVRFVISVAYKESENPRWFEATVTMTISAECDPEDFVGYAQDIAVETVEEWVSLPWDEIEAVRKETLRQVSDFDSAIDISVMDMDKGRKVQEATRTWSEEEMRREGGLA